MARLAAPVHPNQGVQQAYRRELERTLERTRDLVQPIILEAWNDLDAFAPGGEGSRRLAPELPQAVADSALLLHGLPHPQRMPALVMDISYAEMIASYERRLAEALALVDQEAGTLAFHFAEEAAVSASNALKHNLSAALNQTVGFTMTPALRMEIESIVRANVTLISSLSEKYTGQLAETILESVERGRDLHGLRGALMERFGAAQSRADLIARDQNNKATAAIDRQRKLDLGITQSVWIHTPGSLDPRPDHLAANGKLYDTATGLYFESAGAFVLPGEEINCGCVSRAYIPNQLAWAGLGRSARSGQLRLAA